MKLKLLISADQKSKYINNGATIGSLMTIKFQRDASLELQKFIVIPFTFINPDYLSSVGLLT